MNRYNDVFHEEIIVRKNRGFSNALYAFLNIFMYITAIFGAMSLLNILQSIGNTPILINNIVSFLGFGGVAAGIYFYKDNLKTDYEYSYTNGILDIAKVINNKKRKELISVDTKKELELIAPIMTNGFDKYQKTSNIKKVNAWLNRDMKKHFAIIRKDSEKILLIFEPRDEFVKVIKKYNPSKVKTQ